MTKELKTGSALRVRTLAQQIADDLGAAIMRGEYRPGERLRETAIAERYEVSRGPVREAIRALAQRGFAVFFARRGAFVVELSLDDFVDLFNTQLALLGLAARYFATVGTPEAQEILDASVERLRAHAERPDADPIAFALDVGAVSVAVHRHCGSPSLAKLIPQQIDRTVWGTIWRHEHLDYTTPDRRREAAAAYTELAAAIRRGDGSEADRRMRSILMRARDIATESLSRTRAESFDHRRLIQT